MPPSGIRNASHTFENAFRKIENASHALRMIFRRIENASHALRMLFEELKMLLPSFLKFENNSFLFSFRNC